MSKNHYHEVSNTYYGYHAKAIYRITRLEKHKNNPSYPVFIAKFRMIVDNLSNCHSKLSKIKAEKGYKMLDFSLFKRDDFFIERGKLVGDIKKAQSFAMNLINTHALDPLVNEKSCEEYELGLFLMHHISNIEEGVSYIEPSDKSNKDDIKEKQIVEPVNKEGSTSVVEIIPAAEIVNQQNKIVEKKPIIKTNLFQLAGF